MTEKVEKSYCPGCGKTVTVFALLAEGNVVYRCMQCGMEVDPPPRASAYTEDPGKFLQDRLDEGAQNEVPTAKMPQPTAKPKPQPRAVQTPPEQPAQKVQPKKLAYVMIAEDSKLLNELLNDLLIEENFAQTVSASLDGDEFIQKFTESLIANNPPNLIILDINLPAIDGMNICVSIRAIERAFGLKKGRPILFFTSKEIDQHLKKLIDAYPPARYINKGRDADPARMAERIRKVMEALLKD